MRDFRKRWIVVMIVALALVGFLMRDLLRPQTPSAPLRIAVVMGPASGLVFLAEKLGYFKDMGVHVQVESYPGSVETAEALESKRVDLAAVSDAFAAEAFVRGQPIVILSQLHNSQRQSAIVVRRSSGIVRLADLRGHSLAVTEEADLRYFLERSFVANGVLPSDVNVVVLSSQAALDAFRKGEVSALVSRRSRLVQLEDEMGSQALRVLDTSGQIESSILVGFSETVQERGPEIEAALRALALAYDFYLERRDDAYLALLDLMKNQVSASHMMQIWAFMNLDLSLSNVLLLNLREQQTWFEKILAVQEESDIERSFANEILRRVRPDLVTIM